MGSMNSRSPLVCLASVSPRRRELLAQIGVPHIVVGADIDETAQIGEAPRDYVLRMARQKALTVRERGESLPVLAADTTVVLDDVFMGSRGIAKTGSPCSADCPVERTQSLLPSRLRMRAG